MSGKSPTWDVIKGYFTPADRGCMVDVETANPRLDLHDYESVAAYIRESPENKARILDYLRSGHMPPGGPRWDEEQLSNFEAWIEAGFPEKKPSPMPPVTPG